MNLACVLPGACHGASSLMNWKLCFQRVQRGACSNILDRRKLMLKTPTMTWLETKVKASSFDTRRIWLHIVTLCSVSVCVVVTLEARFLV